MLIGIPKEIRAGQTLVAATPNTVQKLIALGYTVSVEQGAGELANYFDQQFEEAGASLVSTAEAWAADIVVCLDAPSLEQLALMKEGATLLSRLDPQNNTELLEACAQRKITALALDAVPRISRAQSLDVRSSLMNVAGYRAVIEAANAFGRQFTGAVTAAGRVNPAKVYVIGVGVAGLAAIGTAGSMGAEVFATDVRSDVADQVQSLGATFVEIPVSQVSTDGYARELDKDDQARTQEVYMHQASKSDIVITTAQVPGRPAPLLLTAEAVSTMMPGSVVVDMGASDLGSNCALTEPGKVITTENGIDTIHIDRIDRAFPLNFVIFELLNSTYSFKGDVSDALVRALEQNSGTGKRFYSKSHVAYIDRGRIMVTPIPADDPCQVQVEAGAPRCYCGNSVLYFELRDIDDIQGFGVPEHIAQVDADKLKYPLTVRRWQEGDWFIPYGMSGRKKVSDYLIDHKVPLPEKARQFVLLSGDEIVWLVGRRIDDRYRLTAETENVLRITKEII